MATGQLQGGGVFSWPDVPELGYETWAEMSGMHPAHPLVGGNAGAPAYGSGHRQVALAAPDPTQGVAQGSPARAHWSELFNFSGNPIGWVAMLAILYLAVSAIHVRAGVSGRFGR